MSWLSLNGNYRVLGNPGRRFRGLGYLGAVSPYATDQPIGRATQQAADLRNRIQALRNQAEALWSQYDALEQNIRIVSAAEGSSSLSVLNLKKSQTGAEQAALRLEDQAADLNDQLEVVERRIEDLKRAYEQQQKAAETQAMQAAATSIPTIANRLAPGSVSSPAAPATPKVTTQGPGGQGASVPAGQILQQGPITETSPQQVVAYKAGSILSSLGPFYQQAGAGLLSPLEPPKVAWGATEQEVPSWVWAGVAGLGILGTVALFAWAMRS